jgi:methionyl aminopeptidase
MINIKSSREIALMKKAGEILANVFDVLEPLCQPGITTKHLSDIAEKVIRDAGAIPAEKGYYGYPAAICASINDVVVHGIPSSQKLKNGDIISLDIVVSYQGYMADACRTFPVGEVSPMAQKLIDVTRECFFEAMKFARPGNQIGDLSAAIQSHAEANGFSVTHDYTGHGLGRDMHEDPNVPNFGKPHTGVVLKEGMTIAVEPIILQGNNKTRVLRDGWTAVTCDHKLAAHYENSIVITKDGYEILTKKQEGELING